MLRILTVGLLCGLPVILSFLSLYQISRREIRSFRWGIVILKFSEPFPIRIPTHLTNKVIAYKGITFKFVSRKLGLFQTTVIGRRLVGSDYPPISGFPLLGEIILDETGVAKIILRIPNSIIFLYICILIAVFGFTILGKDVTIDPSFTIMAILFLTIFVVFLFFIEMAQLRMGVQKIKEYIAENI